MGCKMTKADIQREVDANYEKFLELLPSLLPVQRDRFALMKGGRIIAFYSTAKDARTAAEAFIEDKLYSIQKVTDMSVDLGYFSHAMHRS
jgi:hypothetical protein